MRRSCLRLVNEGVLAGVNAGQQTSKGVEFAFSKSDFDREGWSFKLAATYLNSTIKYGSFPNGNNVIDLLNNYINQYNSFTLQGNPALAGLPCFTAGSAGSPGAPTACSTCVPVARTGRGALKLSDISLPTSAR